MTIRGVTTRTRTYVHRVGQHSDEDVTLQQMQDAVFAARAGGMPLDSSVYLGTDPATEEAVIRFVHATILREWEAQ